jgi:GDP-D-mannose dehydratase
LRKYVESDELTCGRRRLTCFLRDCTKARQILGWQPKVNFPQLVGMMIDIGMMIEC